MAYLPKMRVTLGCDCIDLTVFPQKTRCHCWTPPQPSGNRPQIAADDRTRLLPPVARQSRTEDAQPIWGGRDRAAEEWQERAERTLVEAWKPLDPETERRLVEDWQAECRKTAATSWILDRAALTAPYRLGYSFGPRPADETAVFPVTPAQPAANDSDPWNEGSPWLIAVGFVLAGVLLLTGIGLGAWWF